MIIERLRGRGELQTSELGQMGVSRQRVALLRRAGILERVAHGRYRLAARYERLNPLDDISSQ